MLQGPLSGKAVAVQCIYLLIWMGKNKKDIFSTLILRDNKKANVKTYMEKFSWYFNPRANSVHEISLPCKRSRRGPTDQHITELHNPCLRLWIQCYYQRWMVCDRLACSMTSTKLHEKLLQVGSLLSLIQAASIAWTHVETKFQVKTMNSPFYQDITIKPEIDLIQKPKSQAHHSQQKTKQGMLFLWGNFHHNTNVL